MIVMDKIFNPTSGINHSHQGDSDKPGDNACAACSSGHTRLTQTLRRWMQLSNLEHGEVLPSREHLVKQGLAKRCLQILITTQLTAKEIKENEHCSDSRAETITQTTG